MGIMSLALQEPIAVPESEERQVQELNSLLHRGRDALISVSGEKVEFPDTLELRLQTQASLKYIEAWVGYTASSRDFLRACEAAGQP